MNDREYLIQQLCHQILHMPSPDGNPMRSTPGVEQVATGDVRLDVEIRGMVTNMRRQIWADQGAWTKRIVEEIERQAAAIDVDKIIVEKVRAELGRTLHEIEALVRHKLNERISSAVYDAIERYGEIKRTINDMTSKLLAGLQEVKKR